MKKTITKFALVSVFKTAVIPIVCFCFLATSESAEMTDRMQSLQGTTTAYPGPNCWNTSLFISEIAQYRRAVAEEEMTYWMNSPLCKELAVNEEARAGDIITIRSNNGESVLEMHGFTYLTKESSFSKSGFDIQFPYEFVTSEYVYQLFALGDYGDYKANPDCRRVKGIPDLTKCPVYANVFRCTSYKNFLNSARFLSKIDYKKIDDKFLAFEKKISEATVGSRNYNPEKAAALNQEFVIIQTEYVNYIKNHKIDSVLWESFNVRLTSFHVQLDLLADELGK